jgi:hypothetical protein
MSVTVHTHTIDWYLQLNLTCDAALAQKRSATAEAVAKKITRARVIELLRLFLFSPVGVEFTQQFTNELVVLDAEFPLSNNAQELRMMAGLVMITTFEESSYEKQAKAFALGLRAASFPSGRVKAIQPAILMEAENYLRSQAGRNRPNDFGTDIAPDATKTLLARGKALVEAEAGADEAKKTTARTAHRDSIPSAIVNSHRGLAKRIEQLAEESALLWWVLAEHSDTLQKAVCKLEPDAYALVAAAEAAQRTMQLPPPPSIGPLLTRALQPCMANKEKLVLSDYIKATESVWRAGYVKSVNVADCRDLSPICAALEKMEELGNAATALKAVSKLCPGVKGDLPLMPSQAAEQFYNEILFHRALSVATT